MKKKYSKPYMVVESFQLNAAIAASCSSEGKFALNFYLSNCDLEDEIPGAGYFGAVCGFDVTNPDFCYHGPVVPNEQFMCS